MDSVNLIEMANEQLTLAQQRDSGRQSQTVHGGHENDLRQTLICLVGGHELNEHDSPGEATLQVLFGRISVTAGEDKVFLSTGDYFIIPRLRHSVDAVTDAAFLLTVATRGR